MLGREGAPHGEPCRSRAPGAAGLQSLGALLWEVALVLQPIRYGPLHIQVTDTNGASLVEKRASAGDAAKAGEWIDFMDALRSDTSMLVFARKTDTWQMEKHPATDESVVVPRGHVGAVSFGGVAKTGGTSLFHSACKGAIAESRGETVTNLKAVVSDWISPGTDYKASELPMDILTSKSGAFPSPMKQASNYGKIMKMLKKASKK